jgi:hypothetical protein
MVDERPADRQFLTDLHTNRYFGDVSSSVCSRHPDLAQYRDGLSRFSLGTAGQPA